MDRKSHMKHAFGSIAILQPDLFGHLAAQSETKPRCREHFFLFFKHKNSDEFYFIIPLYVQMTLPLPWFKTIHKKWFRLEITSRTSANR